MKPDKRGVAYAKITFVSVVWGLSFVASKHALNEGFTPFTLALARYALVVAVMLPLLRAKEGRIKLPARRDIPAFIATGVTGVSLYYILEGMGVARTTVSNASLVIASIPVLSLLWGALRGRKYRAACWLGVLLSVIGVFFVVYFGASDEAGGINQSVLVGNLLLVGASACWVTYIEISDRLLTRYSSLSLTVWQSVAGLVTLVPVALFETGGIVIPPLGGWLAILYLALFCSVLGFVWYADALSALSPMQAAIFVNLNPLVAVIGGILIFGDPFTIWQGLGGALVIGSVLLVNVGMRKRADM